jgi:ribosomal-protein-alanine N-acetyltransferase
MKSPLIQTSRYAIRPFQAEDAALWQVWDVDPDVQGHMPEPANEPQPLAEQLAYIAECESDDEGYYWSIEANGGPTIGTVALTEFDAHHKTADFGIVIGDKTYWGKSVATEVGAAVVGYAFSNLNIEHIGAEVEGANVPMQRVLEKIGFTQDGLFKSARVKNGRRIDVAHFGIVVGGAN